MKTYESTKMDVMKFVNTTLIELYDERPLENVLGVEMFRPPGWSTSARRRWPATACHRQLKAYFRHRGLEAELIFFPVERLRQRGRAAAAAQVVEQYPDCAIDITGGTDAVLFAAGLLCAESEIPVFTYSRKKNCFYNIHNAAFAADRPCQVIYSVEDCFRMAGGSMRQGRVDNAILSRYLEDYEPFFRLYLEHRRDWTRIVTYFQRVSPPRRTAPTSGGPGPYTVKGERGSRIDAPEEALRDLEVLGFLQELEITPGRGVSFRFRDDQIRAWLRDVGSVLELYVYKACLDTELFDDVRTSAVVDWEGDKRSNAVSNELDVMCHPGRDPGVHQLQDLRREDRGPQRAGHPAGPLRRADRPGRHRHGGAGPHRDAKPCLRAEHPGHRPERSAGRQDPQAPGDPDAIKSEAPPGVGLQNSN